MNKKTLGQFYTTNYSYILDKMRIPRGVTTVIEPFVGKGDLLKFLPISKYHIEKYDIEPQDDETILRDTVLNPPL